MRDSETLRSCSRALQGEYGDELLNMTATYCPGYLVDEVSQRCHLLAAPVSERGRT